MSEVQRLLEQLAGRTMPGGCEDCDAVQTVVQDDEVPNLFALRVEHDDTCPRWRSMQLRRRR